METIIYLRLKALCKNRTATEKTIANALERGWITEERYEECKRIIESVGNSLSTEE